MDDDLKRMMRQYRLSGPLLVALLICLFLYKGLGLEFRTAAIISTVLFLCDYIGIGWMLRRDEEGDNER